MQCKDVRKDSGRKGDCRMANLYFRVPLLEGKVGKDGGIEKIYERNLPHHDEIANWLPKCWEADDPVQYFDETARKLIDSSRMYMVRQKDGRTVAIVELKPVPGLRWSSKKRNAVFEEMDAQICDGFGESYDYASIPGVPEEFKLLVG